MNRCRFQIIFGLILAVIFAAFCVWQSPGLIQGRLTSAEIDRYMKIIEKDLPFPPEDKAVTMQRLRDWAAADDGQPVYMLNLMRFYDKLRRFPGTPDFNGTPQQSNQKYEDVALPLLSKTGSYALFGTATRAKKTAAAKAAAVWQPAKRLPYMT